MNIKTQTTYSIILLLIFVINPLSAEVFSWQDETGKQHFSDKPHIDAMVMKLKPQHSYHTIKRVSDGDTIVLENNNKIRLLGINTPEVAKGRSPAEAGGNRAKNWLIKRLKNQRVRLEYDAVKQDKYNRTLAYVFTENNENINLELVANGLASLSIYPPSLKYIDKFIRAEDKALQEKFGIWNLQAYAPKKAKSIKSGSYYGWHRVVGKVISIKTARKYHYVNFSNKFALKIPREPRALFPNIDFYKGKKIEARGWISKSKDRYSMFIRHASAIKILKI